MKTSNSSHRKRWLAIAVLLVAVLAVGGAFATGVRMPAFDASAASPAEHRVVFQVNADSPVPMKHAVSNSINLVRYYRKMNEPVQVEIVAYGPGITMFRSDTSPVRKVLKYINREFPEISFTVCGNTKSIIEHREGHVIPLIDGTEIVPFGIVRLVQLQEAGWSYIRP